MNKIMTKWIAVFLVVVSQHVWAAPVTDTVIVGSQEWAQVDLFINNSWNTINAQCPSGVCGATSTINTYDLDGWTWASVVIVQDLFNSFTGQVSLTPRTFTETGSTWAPIITSIFRPTVTTGVQANVLGISSTPHPTLRTAAYFPKVTNVLLQSSSDEVTTSELIAKADRSPFVGAWFVRDATPSPVPIPAAAWLFGSALLGLGALKRKKA